MSSFGEASITQMRCCLLPSCPKTAPYALACRTCVYVAIRSIYIESKNIFNGINVNMHSTYVITFCETTFISLSGDSFCVESVESTFRKAAELHFKHLFIYLFMVYPTRQPVT